MRHLRLLAALAAVIVLLITFGAGPAAADGDEKPIIISAFPNAPGMVTLEWVHSGDDVFWFVVELETPFAYWTPDHDKRVWSVTGLEPSTTYRFRVCAVYDFNRICSDEDGIGYVSITTMPPEQPPPPPPPPVHAPLPAPVLTATARSVSEIYLTWQFPGYEARLTSAALYRDGAFI
ncbi:MAG: fibronectin type III domain-containing protein, partial [Dehalococcoidia bacterium]